MTGFQKDFTPFQVGFGLKVGKNGWINKNTLIYAYSRDFCYWGLGNRNNLGKIRYKNQFIPCSRDFCYWGLGKEINLRKKS